MAGINFMEEPWLGLSAASTRTTLGATDIRKVLTLRDDFKRLRQRLKKRDDQVAYIRSVFTPDSTPDAMSKFDQYYNHYFPKNEGYDPVCSQFFQTGQKMFLYEMIFTCCNLDLLSQKANKMLSHGELPQRKEIPKSGIRKAKLSPAIEELKKKVSLLITLLNSALHDDKEANVNATAISHQLEPPPISTRPSGENRKITIGRDPSKEVGSCLSEICVPYPTGNGVSCETETSALQVNSSESTKKSQNAAQRCRSLEILIEHQEKDIATLKSANEYLQRQVKSLKHTLESKKTCWANTENSLLRHLQKETELTSGYKDLTIYEQFQELMTALHAKQVNLQEKVRVCQEKLQIMEKNRTQHTKSLINEIEEHCEDTTKSTLQKSVSVKHQLPFESIERVAATKSLTRRPKTAGPTMTSPHKNCASTKEKIFVHVASKIKGDWWFLFSHLMQEAGVSFLTATRLKMDIEQSYPNSSHKQAMEGLRQWKRHIPGKKLHVKKLKASLLACHRKELADYVMKQGSASEEVTSSDAL